MSDEKSLSSIVLVDKYLEKKEINDPVRERTPHRFWPTQASIIYNPPKGDPYVVGSCIRKEWYRMMQTPVSNPMDARAVRIVTIGKLVEQKEIEWAKEAGVFLENNVKFESKIGDLTISGEVDAFYKNAAGNKIGIEYKTGYGYMFASETMGNTRKVGAPKPAHLMQVALYLNHFEDIPYFNIVYIDRGDMEKGEHTIKLFKASDINKRVPIVNGEPKPEFSIGAMYRRYKLLDDYCEKKEVPPRDFEIRYNKDKVDALFAVGRLSKTKFEEFQKGKLVGDWECMYCPFRTTCWGGRY